MNSKRKTLKTFIPITSKNLASVNFIYLRLFNSYVYISRNSVFVFCLFAYVAHENSRKTFKIKTCFKGTVTQDLSLEINEICISYLGTSLRGHIVVQHQLINAFLHDFQNTK